MNIAQNLKALTDHIHTKAKACGRDPSTIRLVAVSKTKSTEEIAQAHRCGQIDFGENYAQELAKKAPDFAESEHMRWHFIGHLQKNKIALVLPHIHLLHTLDNLPLAHALENKLKSLNRRLSVLLQVKTSQESGKSGCLPEDLPALLQAVANLPHLQVRGLMTIGTQTNNTEITRHEMRSLKSLLMQLNASGMSPTPLTELSMGMSSDYEIAIEEGATWLRIGSAIFGSR